MTDHINRNRCDNRIVNLREISDHESNINKRPHKISASGLRGVSIRKDCKSRPYRATAKKANGKQVFLGLYANAKEAQKAYLSYYKSRGIKIKL